MTNCPTCQTLLDRSTTLVEGVTVLRCKRCREFRIEGDTEMIGPTADPIKELRLRAYRLDAIATEKEAIESEANDVRWTRLDAGGEFA